MAEISVIVCVAFDHRAPADGLQQFRNCVTSCHYVEKVMEVCGTFDLIICGRCSSLEEYTANMEQIREPLSKYVARIETNFVGRTSERASSLTPSEAMWVPCGDGRKRVECRLIDKVVAEGDYMRIHVADWSCLVHETMERLFKRLRDCGFVKLHRSWLVRSDFIDRLIHDDKKWVARLIDGTHVSVAKSHVKEVLSLFGDDSSPPEVTSANGKPLTDPMVPVNEKLRQD